MSEGNFSPDDQHIIQGAYEHYFRQFEDELKKLSTQRLVEIVEETDSVCEGCHEMAGNQAACSIEYAGLFGCMGHETGFDPTAMPHPLPGIDAIVDSTESSDQKEKQHAKHVLQAIEDSFTRAKEAAIDSIPDFLQGRRGYDVGTGMQTLQGRALDQAVYGHAGLREKNALDQHRITRQQPSGLQDIFSLSHNVPSWKPVDKENMIQELGEIGMEIPQDVPVKTIANTFIRHRDRLVAELVDNGHEGSGLESDTLKELQTILSEEGRQGGKKPRTTAEGGTRRSKRSKRKSVRALLNKRGTQSRGKRKTLRRKHNRKRQTRGYKQRRF